MKSCLIVEDSSVIRRIVARILVSRDYAVGQASTGAEALAAARACSHDLIIVDATLPDRLPHELIRDLAAITGRAAPLIAVLLHQFDLATVARCRRAGAAGHIMKPFTRDQLFARIDRLEARRVAIAA